MLRKLLDSAAPLFESGKKLEKFYPLYEAADTFIYTTKDRTSGLTHVRDGMDSKRMMMTVIVALFPAILFGMYNTGLQVSRGVLVIGLENVSDWHISFITFLGIAPNPDSISANLFLGFIYFLPIYIVTNVVGGAWEVLFSVVRKHEINEGMLVTGFLFPMILPATIPLWQVALGISFGIVIGKEIFGGVGKNILNPALTARAFLFFAYPGQISGDSAWIIDGVSQATALSQVAAGGLTDISYTWFQSFIGTIPGSFGETSTLAILIGAFVLIKTGIGSWRIMLSLLVMSVLTSLLFNIIGSDTNPAFMLSPLWHLVLGGLAFGAVFMATDPVSASMTAKGQYYYGGLIGVMVILIRVVNPAFPEGMMLAILFANLFAPLIDYFVVENHIKRRRRIQS
ncbi:MAG: NADH:ubiquinone reductase (Na(+)-transporting) subunit B [Deltaproteobacteria bacterium]|jgi:Na+-transporting NADH:ubiquinone oxidoreductase subunit B|nr:NADH:ubiquinone reductase (Na(+)-transporting) subunit B [Deltaproteobacteria bacterium]